MTEIDVCEHVLYQLCNARVRPWPFPHFYAHNVFPNEFYDRIVKQLAQKTDFYAQKGASYNGRTFAGPTMDSEVAFMQTPRFLREVVSLFLPALKARYQGRKLVTFADLRFVRDCKGYFIGPHTDASWKIASLLFYLPFDGWHTSAGTSLYTPKDRTFTCPGGPHHRFESFDRITTAPYTPNTCFGFLKTEDSFHGVEPILDDFKRDVLLFNIYDQELYSQTHANSDIPPEAAL